MMNKTWWNEFEAIPFPSGEYIMKYDDVVRKMETIAQDMANDAKEFDGKPFNGKTVATYLGYQGAAIAALADTIKLLIQHDRRIILLAKNP